MSRKAARDAAEDQDATEDPDAAEEQDAAGDQEKSAATEAEATDHHGFWDGPKRRGDENDDAYAVVIDADGDLAGEQETLTYMGNVAQIDVGEVSQLAEWAESKACRECTSEIREHHEPALLQHDECRTALRVGHLLRRYR